MFKRLFTGFLDFTIPQLCVSCIKPVGQNRRFVCRNCEEKLERFGSSHPWRDDFVTKGYIDNSLSMYRFIKDTPIQHLLHSLKYEKMRSIGIMLGKNIAEIIPCNINYDYLVPVPLHISKERERTYNQSDFICRGISGVTGIPVLPRLLKRNRFTKSQTKMDRVQRIENVRGAFEINHLQAEFLIGKNVILVDDVITTGSTIIECARILKENRAANVLICSAAYDALG